MSSKSSFLVRQRLINISKWRKCQTSKLRHYLSLYDYKIFDDHVLYMFGQAYGSSLSLLQEAKQACLGGHQKIVRESVHSKLIPCSVLRWFCFALLDIIGLLVRYNRKQPRQGIPHKAITLISPLTRLKVSQESNSTYCNALLQITKESAVP